MVYFVQNVQKYRRYKEFEIYVKISTGATTSQEMLKQTVNKNNIHVPVGVSQVLQLVVMILLINDCYVMSLVVIISRMNFVLYRNDERWGNFFYLSWKLTLRPSRPMHYQSNRNTKKRPNDKGPTAATRGLDVVTVPRLSDKVEGKCQKYSRNRPFTLVPLNQEPPAALQHGFGEQGPSFKDKKKIPELESST